MNQIRYPYILLAIVFEVCPMNVTGPLNIQASNLVWPTLFILDPH